MKKIFLDFDGTIVNSIKAFCTVYNNVFNEEKGYKPADWSKVDKWNFEDECPLATHYVEEIFKSYGFFDVLDVINDNTIEVLDKLKERFEVIVCTIGSPENISRKSRWIENNLGIKDMILLSKSDVVMDKSIVDMSNGVIVDDHQNNLLNSDADVKICFGEVKEWNEEWNGLRAKDWTELEKMLLELL